MARKTQMAERLKAEKKQKAIAILRDCPTSPRKMRLVADIIRGVEINKALGILRYSKKEASIRMESLLKSAIANWEAKNQGERLEDAQLCGYHFIYYEGDVVRTLANTVRATLWCGLDSLQHTTAVYEYLLNAELCVLKTLALVLCLPVSNC